MHKYPKMKNFNEYPQLGIFMDIHKSYEFYDIHKALWISLNDLLISITPPELWIPIYTGAYGQRYGWFMDFH